MAAAAGVVLMLAMLAGVAGRSRAVPAAAPSTAPVATPPDLSSMSPREQFDRLYNRVMRASETGDAQTLETFGPMALMAYTQLDSVDADARYHAALLRLHSGDSAGALALADTILTVQPTHLFGFIVRGSVARMNQDQAALAVIYADILRVWDPEMAVGRPEYDDHRTMLDSYKAEASRGAGR